MHVQCLSEEVSRAPFRDGLSRLDVCVQEIERALAEDVAEGTNDQGATPPSKDEESAAKSGDNEMTARGDAAEAVDAFSVATSVASNMTDAFKTVEDAKVAHYTVTKVTKTKAEGAPGEDAVQFESDNGAFRDIDGAAATSGASSVTGATMLKSEDGTKPSFEFAKEEPGFDIPDAVDGSDGEDWSVISD